MSSNLEMSHMTTLGHECVSDSFKAKKGVIQLSSYSLVFHHWQRSHWFVLLWVFWVHSCESQNHPWWTGAPSPMVTPMVTLHTQPEQSQYRSLWLCEVFWFSKTFCLHSKPADVLGGEKSSHLLTLQCEWTILPNACAACDSFIKEPRTRVPKYFIC